MDKENKKLAKKVMQLERYINATFARPLLVEEALKSRGTTLLVECFRISEEMLEIEPREVKDETLEQGRLK